MMVEMQIGAHLIAFPVRFRIARALILYSQHVVVSLACGNLRGAGSGVLYRGQGWLARQLWNGQLRQRLAALSPASLEGGWQPLLDDALAIEPGLAFAIDAALWDLKGQFLGQSVATMLGGLRQPAMPITEQIFIGAWPQSRAALERIMARGTRRIKVKIGAGLRRDADQVRRVRDLVGGEVELRVDANRAYTFRESVGLYRQLADLGVTAVEEPLCESWPAVRQLRKTVGLPVMLDESILTVHDLGRAIRAEAIDSLNLKLSRVGGLSQALHYRRLCQEAGVTVGLGCSEDLGPGMAAILHFAATTNDLLATEGLGNLRLEADLVRQPPIIRNGEVALPAGPGLGVELRPEWPNDLSGRAHVFDLDRGPAGRLRAFSALVRLRQKAANLLLRAGRLRCGFARLN